MGNWVVRDKGEVHSIEEHEGRHDRTSSNSLRIKVRMTRRQLKELMAQVDMNKGRDSEELGRVILEECLEGRLSAGIVVAVAENHDDQVLKYAKGNLLLSTICEEEQEEHEHIL